MTIAASLHAGRGLWANPHVQTLLGHLGRPKASPFLTRERLDLPDGDFVDLDDTGEPPGSDPGPRPIAGPGPWSPGPQPIAGPGPWSPGPQPIAGPGPWSPGPQPRTAPIVLVLHGLEGSSGSGYVRLVASGLLGRGARVYALNFRSCSGEPNRAPRLYHSGDTADAALVLGLLRARHPGRPLGAVGFSLGGNVLLKYLGEAGDAALVDRAVAVSVPFDLGRCADALARGFSRVYGRALLGSMQRKVEGRRGELGARCDVARGLRARTFREFDDAVTGPLHGFRDAEDYFEQSSSARYVAAIRRPTTLLHAADDPFVPPAAIPFAEARAAGCVRLEVSPTGGHVGFVVGRPWQGASAFAAERAAARLLVPE